jgi:hypothetical protein
LLQEIDRAVSYRGESAGNVCTMRNQTGGAPCPLAAHPIPSTTRRAPDTPTHQIQRRQVRHRRQRLRQRTRSLRPEFVAHLPSPRPWCDQPSPYLPPSSPLAALLTLTHTPRSARRPSSSPLSFSTLGTKRRHASE